jgi:hypothetical protein
MESQANALIAAEKPGRGLHTKRGKAAYRLNATTHGLSCKTVVIRGERNSDWESHRAGMIETVAPVGALELELTEQVAVLTWRMRRVVRYESSVMSGKTDGNGRPIAEVHTIPLRPQPRTREMIKAEIKSAQTDCERLAALKEGYCRLKSATAGQRFNGQEAWELIVHGSDCMTEFGDFGGNPRDTCFLMHIDVPNEFQYRPETWEGWTSDHLLKAMWHFGQSKAINPPAVIERITDKIQSEKEKLQYRVQQLETELLLLPAATEKSEEKETIEDHEPIFDPVMLINVMRYGSYLRRELNETLEMLDRLQSNRKGTIVKHQ